MSVVVGEYVTREPEYAAYDPEAPAVARLLADAIVAQARTLRVEHVGSSSVPGCAGKGYVDLLVLYADGDLDTAKEALAALGFQRQTSRDPFPEERPMRTGSVVHRGRAYLIHAHVVAASAVEVGELLGFRDRLRSDDALCRAYEADKRRILAGGVRDGVEYAERKTEFIRGALAHDARATEDDGP